MKRKLSKFEGEKAVHEARKRDHERSKLSEGKRLRAKEDADEIVDGHISLKEKSDRALDRKHNAEGRDRAMETVYKGVHQDKSIKRIIL